MDNSATLLIQGIDATITSLKSTIIILETLKDNVKKQSDIIPSELLKEIQAQDRMGLNHPKEYYIPTYSSDIYDTLLLSGEIFEIAGRVYPVDTRNFVPYTEGC